MKNKLTKWGLAFFGAVVAAAGTVYWLDWRYRLKETTKQAGYTPEDGQQVKGLQLQQVAGDRLSPEAKTVVPTPGQLRERFRAHSECA